LHFGSLVAAVGSYLDVATQGGRWLLRIEDLDTPRVVPGCAAQMLRTLEHYGFEWFGAVLYQSTRTEAYRAALAQLRTQQLTFECSCSRKDLGAASEDDAGGAYPGTCRRGPTKPGPTATRFRVNDGTSVTFHDLYQGTHTQPLSAVGDFVVRRRDDLVTYQLAVVVDDAYQGVNRVVRGADLLGCTPWQMALQDALGLPRVVYGHLPLVTEPDGSKLAKSRRSIALDFPRVSSHLFAALAALRQEPPLELAQDSPAAIWAWARSHWRPERLQGVQRVQLSPASDTF
jgi:glutamyl-Q tRNA(Asp) synthetase